MNAKNHAIGNSAEPASTRRGFGRLCAIAFFFCLVAIAATSIMNPVYAQTGEASISGVVTDQRGVAMVGVPVTAINSATGQKVMAITSASGNYTMTALPVGSYTMTVRSPGFKQLSKSGIILTAEQSAGINFQLSIGGLTQTVKVEANGPNLQTQNASLSQNISAAYITQLPLNGRNPGSLVTLTAGVVPGTGLAYFTSVGLTNFNDTLAGASGGRAGSIYFLLDGANNMDPATLFGAPFPNPDATEEFSVISNNPGAQYGFAPGGVVSIVTRSGTNMWHGNAFEFLRNKNLNSEDYFSHEASDLKRNQYGFSVGGPLRRDKLFIFGNYQRTSESNSNTGTTTFVPNAAELSGNWSQLLTGTSANLCGSGGPANLNFDTGQLFQPGTAKNYVCPVGSANAGQTVQVKTPYRGNQINPSTYNSIALSIEDNLPKTTAANNLILVPAYGYTDSTNEFTLRTDYILSAKDRVFGHVFRQAYDLPPVTGNGDFLAAAASWGNTYTSYTLGWTHTFSDSLLNNASFSIAPSNSNSESELTNKTGQSVSLTTLGMKVPYPPGYPNSIQGFSVNSYFSLAGTYGGGQNSRSTTFSDQLTMSKGKHLLVAGVDVLRYNWSEGDDWEASPLVSFTGQTTGDPAADFLTGSIDNFVVGGGEYNKNSVTSVAPFVQDTYHATQHLTLDAGVRWVPYFPATINDGRAAVFVPGQQSTRYPNAPVGMVFPGDKGISDSGGIPNSPWLFSPRIGFAYQPKFMPNTSIRGAFGIFVVPFDNSYYQHNGDNAPFSPTYTLSYIPNGTIPFADPWSVSASTGGTSPFPPFSSADYAPPETAPFFAPVTVAQAFAPNFTLGRDQTWNLSVEKLVSKMLVTVAYVGSQTYHLPLFTDLNPGIYASQGQRTTYPNFSSIFQYQSAGDASYNALEVRVEKRISDGLQFTSNYTFSKALDTITGGNTAYGSVIGDPFDLKWSYGISDLNVPSNWVTSFVYKTPSLSKSNSLVKEVMGNWQSSGIFTLRSGTPFSVVPSGSCANGGNPSFSQEYADRADVVPGQGFHIMQGAKSHWLGQYFNTAAFKCNTAGTFGDSGRNLLAGPRYTNWDLGLTKNFPFGERVNFQFRWEMFNAMNTPHFSDPGANVGGAGYGAITSLASPPRVMQVAGKLSW